MPQEIYLDHAAATPVDPRVIQAVAGAMREIGNPESFNDAGRRAQKLLEGARARVARFLNAHPTEILFYSSGSEANARALAGAKKILTQPTEHPSVLKLARAPRMVSVNREGLVNPDDVAGAITKDTTIVSIMYANNEIGTIQPIKKIARIIRDWRRAHHTTYPYFHVDASQATAYLPMDVQALGVDLLTLNGAKVYGPRDIAVLFVRRGIDRGGGDKNVAGAVGLAKALELLNPADGPRVAKLRDTLIAGIRDALPEARLNGPEGNARLASNVSISIPEVSSEVLLLELDKYGIRAGAGSACTAHSVEPSHVLRAIGTPKRYLDGVVRFSLGRKTTRADIDRVIRVLPSVVQRVRARRNGERPSA